MTAAGTARRAWVIGAGVVLLLAYPVWSLVERARSEAQGSACGANMTSLAHALQMYCEEHNGFLPPADDWSDAILPYVQEGRQCYSCPAARNQVCSYAMNRAAGGTRPSGLSNGASLIVLFESDAGWNAAGGPELLPPFPRHHQRYDRVSFGSSSSGYCLRDYQGTGSRKTWLKRFRGDCSWTPAPAKP